MNIRKVEELRDQGRMTPAGEQAFGHRKENESVVYAHEQAVTAELSAEEHRAFKRDKAAWKFFKGTPPSFK